AFTASTACTICELKNKNAQMVVRQMHVIASVRNVTERMPGENKAEIGGIVLRSRSPFHSSGSGTARRIQTVNSAGIIPTRNTYRGSNLPSNPTVNAAPLIPHT